MNVYKRPEMETDPDKLPGQIVNRPDYPDAITVTKPLHNASRVLHGLSDGIHPLPGLYLRDVIARMQRTEEEFSPHGTVNS